MLVAFMYDRCYYVYNFVILNLKSFSSYNYNYAKKKMKRRKIFCAIGLLYIDQEYPLLACHIHKNIYFLDLPFRDLHCASTYFFFTIFKKCLSRTDIKSKIQTDSRSVASLLKRKLYGSIEIHITMIILTIWRFFKYNQFYL